jgi:hypothetical protein
VNELLLLAVLGISAGAVFQWRFGLICCVAVALLQDPLRKLTPGAPVFFVGLVALTFAGAALGAVLNRVRLHPSAIVGWRQHLQAPALVFLTILALQGFHSMIRWDAPMLPIIGAVFYLVPVAAVMFAHQFAVKFGTHGIQQFLWFYVAASLVWMLSVLAEANGFSHRALGEVGVGQIIYDYGLNRRAVSGLYRASEIAAWHIAMTGCALFIVLNGRKLSVFKTLIVLAVVAYLFYVGVLTGRRKMLVYLVFFAGAYIVLYALYLRGKARLAIFALAGLALASAALVALVPETGDQAFVDQRDWTLANRDARGAWTARALTVFSDIPERFMLLGYRPVEWAIDGFGWMGAGLGTIAQGAQYFGGGALRFGGAAEGGLGKITMDLGVPGLVVFVVLMIAVLREVARRLAVLGQGSRPHAMFAYGLAAMLVANAAAFSVATQVFGDVFVLLMIGWLVGFLLAMPTVAYNELTAAAYRAEQARQNFPTYASNPTLNPPRPSPS